MTIELIALMIVAGLVAGCVGHYVMTDGWTVPRPTLPSAWPEAS